MATILTETGEGLLHDRDFREIIVSCFESDKEMTVGEIFESLSSKRVHCTPDELEYNMNSLIDWNRLNFRRENGSDEMIEKFCLATSSI